MNMATTREVSNSDDVIDSRDIIARIDELEDLETAVNDAMEEVNKASTRVGSGLEDPEEAQQELEDATKTLLDAREDFGEDEQQELKSLRALQEEAEGYCEDWRHGVQLIRYDHFTEAMQDLCDDIGDLPKDLPSYIVIDWDKTAENLKVDYTSVDFDGVEYLVR